MTHQPEPVDIAGLPKAVRLHLLAHDARDAAAALAAFAPEAAVTDDGRTHRGHAAIGEWFEEATSRFTYTATPVGATHDGPGAYTVVQHLEGDFPGGTVDLRHRFTLDGDGLISALVIAP
ncbi:nuclear transport factor 2 family protein [Streptomyces sp. MS19]|uniref:nuclear transport factor 2 family protein n=1 Tax=Streptomyces sp. MS19 TaxID=3385972 RepID=UPI0039A090EB